MIGLPAIIRPSFTLGGRAAASPTTATSSSTSCAAAWMPPRSHQVLVEEVVLGWKEFEMEVVRDMRTTASSSAPSKTSIPMGIHTGDRITVAPALTLTDKEYQIMRDASIACPARDRRRYRRLQRPVRRQSRDGRLVVIEMNPRVSRSSALASKATGFPIAKIAAKLAVGYTLDELDNDITKVTPASFEPTIDYVVTKMPRFTFEKFPGRSPAHHLHEIGGRGHVGRPQLCRIPAKSLPVDGNRPDGLNEVRSHGLKSPSRWMTTAVTGGTGPVPSARPPSGRRPGLPPRAGARRYARACHFDPWFLANIPRHRFRRTAIQADGLPDESEEMMRLKSLGFSDARLAELTDIDELDVRTARARHGSDTGLQADRHLCRRIRPRNALYVFLPMKATG